MTKSKIGQVVSYIVILLVIVAVIGVFAYFTNGFTSDFKTFYVSVNGKDVMSSSGGYTVSPDKPLSVEVKYTFAFNQSETKGYSVKIVPNKTDENFDFSVNGETHYFNDEKDLASGFTIEKKEKSFTVKPKGGTLKSILQAVYPDKEITCESMGYDDMFTLVVTSYNESATIKLNFSIPYKATEIKLDKTIIIF